MPAETGAYTSALGSWAERFKGSPQPPSTHSLPRRFFPIAGCVGVALAQAKPFLPAETVAAEVLRIRPNAWPNLRMIELGDAMLHRRGALVEAASRIYRHRLAQEPGLADMIIANGRAREIELARG